MDNLPVSANSAAYVNTIGASAHLFPDFWSNTGGLFLNTVTSAQPRVRVTATYATEADPGPYPIPPNALVQVASDLHLMVLDQSNCRLYEMWDAVKQADGSWSVGSAAKFDLNSNVQRPANWTSADASGTSMIASVVTYDEAMSGQINHALGMTVPTSQTSFVWPGTHWASYVSGSQYPPMGMRFRLKAGFDISPYPFEVQVILKALKKYGAIVDDNGAAWFLNGLQDPRWNDNNLHTITNVLGSNMEAVDTSSLMVATGSGVVAGSPLALDTIFLDHRAVSAGTPVSAQAILTAPAPAGGAVITLTNSYPAVLGMPATVTVPAGAVSAPFTVTINAIPLTTPVAITGSYNGVTRISPELLVQGSSGQSAPLLSSFALSSGSVIGGASVSATVTLTAPAPAGGTVVALTTSNAAAVGVPASITVAAGTSSATVSLTTTPQSAATTVHVTATLYGESLNAPLALSTSGVTPGPTVSSTVRINAGGAAYTDGSGNVWSADTSFSGGNTWSTSSTVGGTTTPSLYQTCRYGVFAYQAAVPNGSYSVKLKFAEISLNGAGQRQFNVAINGTAVLTNFDIFAQAGWLTAIDKTFPVTVANGQIAIQFSAGAANWPLVSAIEIVPAVTPVFSAIRVNAAGPAYTDASGTSWSADTGYSGGNTWSTTSAISGTNSAALYQTCRWGAFTYTFAVPNGNYSVNLKFAEVSQYGAGRREFNVAINGTAVLTNFDIFAAAGWLTAIDKQFPVSVTNGQIAIQFSQGAADWPLISGIEIVPASAFTPIRFNAAGPAVTEANGNVWSTDGDFAGGNPWSVAGSIAGATTPALYQTCRWGAFGYNIPAPNGNYTVNLKFAEVSLYGAGKRLFNASINGSAVLTNFDIFAQAGWMTAVDRSFPVTVTNGQIAIQFTQGSADWPLVSAIEVLGR